jgi:Thioesterase-like superfamily
MADVPDAFYLPTEDADRFVSTAHTIGPWDRDSQHAGPPSALLTRAVERLPSSIPGPSQIARLTMEILGPVATDEVRVSATVARPGRAVELVEAQLESRGRVAMRTRAWRIRTQEIPLPSELAGAGPVAPPRPGDESGLATAI